MKLASRKKGGRDGTLIVVDRDLGSYAEVGDIAATLQAALDDWQAKSPLLAETYQALCAGDLAGSQPLAVAELASPQEGCARDGDSVRLSSNMEQRFSKLEQFLAEQVYRHPEIAAADARGRQRIDGLFEAYTARPKLLPERFVLRIEEQGIHRVVCDYIAGMTDRFCASKYDRIADS